MQGSGGEELYFPVLLPKATEAPEPRTVEVGDVAYFPPENALCLFCGHTHARTDKHDPVTPVGRIVEGMEDCGIVRQNETGITPRWRTVSAYATATSSIVACS